MNISNKKIRMKELSTSPTHVSVSVRKIDNGFIMNRSMSGPKGYHSVETYHENEPKIDLNSIPMTGDKIKKAAPDRAALKRAAGPKKPRET